MASPLNPHRVGMLGFCFALVVLFVLLAPLADAKRPFGKGPSFRLMGPEQWAEAKKTLDLNAACPCSESWMCLPINKTYEKEVFGFWNTGHVMTVQDIDWNLVTTLSWAPNTTEVVCLAHSYYKRVIVGVPTPIPLTSDKATRQAYVTAIVEQVKAGYWDGVNFDFEDPLACNDPRNQYYVQLIAETTQALHTEVFGSQISIDVAWSPDNIDGRCYDSTGLALAGDFLYVMDYDTRSQVFDRCTASANAPVAGSIRGLQRWMDVGVSADKLVLGIPWYGYQYPCNPGTADTTEICFIPYAPYLGVNCSDAAGGEVAFSNIKQFLYYNASQVTKQPVRDVYTNAMYFNFVTNNGATVNQMWYDDATTVAAKVQVAASMNLRGIGPYTFAFLDPHSQLSPDGNTDAKAFWAALSGFAQQK